MVNHLVCQLCKDGISKKYNGPMRWRAAGQPLQLKEGTRCLFDPSTDWTLSDKYIIHSSLCCALDDISAFLVAAPFAESSPSIDDLCMYLDILEEKSTSMVTKTLIKGHAMYPMNLQTKKKDPSVNRTSRLTISQVLQIY